MRNRTTLLVCCMLAACSDVGFDVRSLTELERAESRWERERPVAYSFAVERICFCPWTGPVRILVDGDSVATRTFVDTGDPVPEPMAGFYPPVDSLFGILREAYARKAHDVSVTYHPTMGFPAEFFIDYEEMTADEELGMRITEQPVSARFDVSGASAR